MERIKNSIADIRMMFKGYRLTASQKQSLVRIGISSLLFIVGLFFKEIFAVSLAIYLAAYIICAYDVILNAVKRVFNGTVFDENMLMTLASVGAFALGEFSEGCAVMILYQLGELFQSIAVNRSRKSIKSMMELRPDTAHKLVGGEVEDVNTEELLAGDICIVRPGERVPVDGIITEGVLEADVSAITGESLPVTLTEGERVISGYINLSSVVRIRATTGDADSTITRILKIVEEQSENKSENEKLITKFAKYYTPFVFALTLIIGFIVPIFAGDFRGWVYKGLSLLVISCPCAFVISVPLTYFGGIGGASLEGILIKGGSVLDVLCRCDTVIMDKTGTLTEGKLSITSVHPTEGADENILKAVAAVSESESNHPIAKSVLEYTGKPSVKCEEFSEYPGRGTAVLSAGHMFFAGTAKFLAELGIEAREADGEDSRRVHFACDKRYVGYIEMKDKIKDGAPEALAEIRKAGISRIGMLSGDKYPVAKSVSDRLGIDICKAELSPEDKLEALKSIKSGGHTVIFAGDGINDAPSLGQADVGIAMGDIGSDAALEAADAVIMDGSLDKIAEAILTARYTNRIVKQNIALTTGIKLLVLILTMIGITSMTAAIFADVGVAVIAILNAMRTLSPKTSVN